MAVFVAFVFVLLWPPAALAILGLLVVYFIVQQAVKLADLDHRELLLLGVLVFLGCSAQTATWLTRPTPAPLDAAPVPVDERQGVNLTAAYDVSWVRGWRADTGLGAYAQPVDSAFWRLEAFEAGSEAPLAEAISALEVAIEAGRTYGLSVVLRHDGTWIDAVLLERTREGRRRLPTTVQAIGPNTVQLHATVPAHDTAAALRSLHLIDLEGDWTYVDLGWPSLTAGGAPSAYAPHALVAAWQEGLVWWVTLGVALATSFTVFRAIDRQGARRWVVRGLVFGLTVQVVVVVLQTLAAGDALSRATGTLLEPNLLAHVAALAALTVFAIAQRPLRDGGAALLAAAVVVWLSGSRSGLVGLALGVLAMGFVLPRDRRARTVYALGAVLVVAAGFVAIGLLGGRLTEPWFASPDVLARLQVWGTSWAAAADRPLSGFGHGSVGWVYEFWPVNEPGPRYRNHHAHNVGLQLLVSFGWPTLLAFALACLALALRTWRRRRHLALVVLLVAVALNSVDMTLFHPAVFLSVVAATVFGMTMEERAGA